MFSEPLLAHPAEIGGAHGTRPSHPAKDDDGDQEDDDRRIRMISGRLWAAAAVSDAGCAVPSRRLPWFRCALMYSAVEGRRLHLVYATFINRRPPSLDDVCRRFGSDANRAIVWRPRGEADAGLEWIKRFVPTM